MKKRLLLLTLIFTICLSVLFFISISNKDKEHNEARISDIIFVKKWMDLEFEEDPKGYFFLQGYIPEGYYLPGDEHEFIFQVDDERVYNLIQLDQLYGVRYSRNENHSNWYIYGIQHTSRPN
ncbi:hypothetical protein [Bacillus kwashiorkori]|uniref:hypothetical protein n=1 Tax=Bacillus kwashiorkori TaxID=1522318 RepID=UPI00078127E4|nr:hypothetical protein [Bacillus kwashiorkori]